MNRISNSMLIGITIVICAASTPCSSAPTGGRKLTTDDITFTIKTSHKLHQIRLDPILLTWYPEVAQQTYLITDARDIGLDIRTNGHTVVTDCGTGHNPRGLNCKLGAEYDVYMEHQRKWWCHFDDDNYVNTHALLRLLSQYDADDGAWYMGKLSHDYPMRFRNARTNHTAHAFFLHGGCGFCISRNLARQMAPYVRGGGLMRLSEEMGGKYNDDCLLGYVINHLLAVNVTLTPLMHSHYRLHVPAMTSLRPGELARQVSLSYSLDDDVRVDVPDSGFDLEKDPTRFFSLHCLVNPNDELCDGGL